jgi:hypothetical protein
VGIVKPIVPIPAHVKVNFLMSKDNKCWDTKKIESLFHDDLAKEISDIPIIDMEATILFHGHMTSLGSQVGI